MSGCRSCARAARRPLDKRGQLGSTRARLWPTAKLPAAQRAARVLGCVPSARVAEARLRRQLARAARAAKRAQQLGLQSTSSRPPQTGLGRLAEPGQSSPRDTQSTVDSLREGSLRAGPAGRPVRRKRKHVPSYGPRWARACGLQRCVLPETRAGAWQGRRAGELAANSIRCTW